MTVAALFVATNGTYFGLPGVEPWDLERDARRYAGPWPVVAHPPCERWGKLAHIHKAKPGLGLGEDGGCFESALASVRRWGGVLEHPEGSAAWDAFGLNAPPKWGGWHVADFHGGWTCCVEQGHYGHPARKATWLYTSGVHPPVLVWGPSSAAQTVDFMSSRDGSRSATPTAFRDLLLSIAQASSRREAA